MNAFQKQKLSKVIQLDRISIMLQDCLIVVCAFTALVIVLGV